MNGFQDVQGNDSNFARDSGPDDRMGKMHTSPFPPPLASNLKLMMESSHSNFPHSADALSGTSHQGPQDDAEPTTAIQNVQVRVPTLPALPLLRFVAESAMNAQRRLLKLVLLPPRLLDDALRADPEAVVMLGFPSGAEVTAADLVDRIKHLQYTALQALLAAYRYGETRVDVKDKVILGLEIGRLALDMLSTLQSEMIREERLSSKRKRPAELDASERVDKSRKTSVGATAASPHANPGTPTVSRNKAVKPSPLRRTSSTREDFATAAHGEISESDADLLTMQRKNARKQEGSRLLKETEDILSSASELGTKSLSKDPEGRSLLLELVMMKAQLTSIQGYHKQALKLLKNTRHDIQKDTTQTHMLYRILLLQTQLEMQAGGDVMAASTTLSDLANLASARHDTHVVLLSKVARLRIIMVNSYFDLVAASLQDIDRILTSRYPPVEGQSFENVLDRLCRQDLSANTDAELAVIMEYSSLRVIWSNRIGDKVNSKASIKMVHHLYDSPRSTKEDSAFSSGIFQLPTAAKPITARYLPRNVATPLTFLITCLAFPDLTSSSPKRVKLVQSALKSFDTFESHEGPYHGDFVKWSGLNDALMMRTELMEIKAECLFDLLTFCIFRAKFEHAQRVTSVLTRHLQIEGLFRTFAPRECLLLGQRAHMLGHHEVALKHYEACRFIAKPGSEMDLMARIGIHCIQLAQAATTDQAASENKQLMQECFNTMAYTFTTAARVIQGTIVDTILASKQTLQSASDAARIFNDSHTQPIILCIAATHFAETRPEQSKKMLRSAWELIRASHGKENDGKDRLDVFGSTGLGLWALSKLEIMGEADRGLDEERARFIRLYEQKRKQELESQAVPVS
ncbi:hypothetical protein NliqN6_1875 [Naganishia liquefaciens]|uniref:Uncharacterized protein n=1 Tax=Naganishia liquefaciens TaxID=104408 RepID=A0A8H3TRB9_9TREE|nr:hypothetical protein NliqN6_1875 [Naganishia liquefaciens]